MTNNKTKAAPAKLGAKPATSLTESIYKRRREEAANARSAPAPVYPVLSNEYAAQLYAKRNSGNPIHPDSD